MSPLAAQGRSYPLASLCAGAGADGSARFVRLLVQPPQFRQPFGNALLQPTRHRLVKAGLRKAWRQVVFAGCVAALFIVRIAVALAVAPKSNAVYTAWNAVRALVQQGGTKPVPAHLRNAPTRLMKDIGHGQGYRYAHDEEGGYAAGENYLPPGLAQTRFYEPVPRGLEQRIAERLAELRRLDEQANKAR